MNWLHKQNGTVIGVAIVVLLGIIAVREYVTDGGGTDASAFVLPTQRQVQEYLVSRGHDIVVDGVIGPETRLAWDRETYGN